MNMKISIKGLNLIKQFEGLRLEAYKPVPTEKFYTIGYGHCSENIKKGQKITNIQAESFLRRDLQRFEIGVSNMLTATVTQNMFDALVSFAYNCGLANLKESTLLKLVNARKFNLASLEFSKWNKAGGKVLKGLTLRREAERKLFIGM